MREFPLLPRLTRQHAAYIGQIVSQWAIVEWILAHITYDLAGVGVKVGRLAIKEGRAEDRVTTIEHLLSVHEVSVLTDLKALKVEAKALEQIRHDVAHGLWLRDPKGFGVYLNKTGGSWAPDPTQPKIPRKIKPEAHFMSADAMRDAEIRIRKLVISLAALHEQVTDALSASREK